MSKQAVMSIEERKAKALEVTRSNVQKGRSAKTGTYLTMFIDVLNGLDEDSAKSRVEIISDISFGIVDEQFAADGGLDFENPEHADAFDAANTKVKAQVAAAISNSQNNTSLSFNPTTKDKYELVKTDDQRYYIIEK